MLELQYWMPTVFEVSSSAACLTGRLLFSLESLVLLAKTVVLRQRSHVWKVVQSVSFLLVGQYQNICRASGILSEDMGGGVRSLAS